MLEGTIFSAGARALLLAGLMCSASAYAQVANEGAPAEDSADRIEDIVVTAQRVEQNIQSVPIAITALSAQELKNRNVQQISDLQSATPNVTFRGGGQSAASTIIGIRGIRNTNVELVNDQPASVYIDGVYQSTALGSSALLGPDVQRIEVLRGPQGTLFGRNSIAGAVSITTQQPKHELEARVMLGGGNLGFMEGSAMLNLPLVADKVAARFNVAYRSDDGYVRETTYNHGLGGNRNFYARGQLLVEPSDGFRVVLQGDYILARNNGAAQQGIYLTPPDFRDALTGATHSTAFTALAISLGLAPTAANYPTVLNYFLSCGGGRTATLGTRCFSPAPATLPTGLFAPSGKMDNKNFYKDYGGSATATVDLTDTIQFKSITSYRKFRQDSPRDFDSTPVIILFSRARPSGKTFTQEGQLTGKLFDGKLQFATGAFYYHFDGIEQANNAILVGLSGPRSYNSLHNEVRNKSIGAYTQATYSITDSFHATGGLRYTSENKSIAVTQFQSQPAPVNQVCTLPVPNATCVNTAKLHYTSWDYTAGLEYSVRENMMTYVRVAKGFQAGGINQRSSTGVPFQQYKPETATNYELGMKADFFDRRARVNLAVFQTDIKDKQKSVPQSFLVNNTPVTVVATLNAATVRIRGVEAELTLVPFENARISGQVGYIDPKYKKFVAAGPGGPGTLDLSDTKFQNVPNWTWGISPSYKIPTAWGEVRAQLDYFWQSSAELQPLLSYPLETEFPGARAAQSSYGLLNGRIAAVIERADLEIAIWGKNLTDKRYFTDGTNLSNSLGFAVGTVGAPRTYGIQLTKSF